MTNRMEQYERDVEAAVARYRAARTAYAAAEAKLRSEGGELPDIAGDVSQRREKLNVARGDLLKLFRSGRYAHSLGDATTRAGLDVDERRDVSSAAG